MKRKYFVSYFIESPKEFSFTGNAVLDFNFKKGNLSEFLEMLAQELNQNLTRPITRCMIYIKFLTELR